VFVVRVDDRHRPRGFADECEAPVVHRRKKDKLHLGPRIDFDVIVKWLSCTLRREKKRSETSLLSKTERGKMAAVASTTLLWSRQRANAKRR
jgi:hypothetical protein